MLQARIEPRMHQNDRVLDKGNNVKIFLHSLGIEGGARARQNDVVLAYGS